MEWIILPTTHLASSTFCVWVVDLSNIGISSDPEALWSLRSRNGDGFEWEVVSEGFQLACLHSRSNPICSLPETVDFVWWSSCWERNYVQTGEDNCLRTVKGHIFLGIVGAPCHIQSLELTKSLQEFLGSDLLYRVLQVLLIWEPQAQHESTNPGSLCRYLQQVAVWRVSWAKNRSSLQRSRLSGSWKDCSAEVLRNYRKMAKLWGSRVSFEHSFLMWDGLLYILVDG